MQKDNLSSLNTQIALCIQKMRYTEAKLVNETIKKEGDLKLVKDYQKDLEVYIKELDSLRRERAYYFNHG